jgi:hypothetical protein
LAIAVLLILAVLWAAVLVPPVLRNRSEGRRGSAFGGMSFKLGGSNPLASRPLGGRASGPYRPGAIPVRSTRVGPPRPNGALGAPGGGMTPAQKRRRDVLTILLCAAVLTLLLALFTRSLPLWGLHVLADLMLGGYVYLLLQLKQRGSVGPTAGRPAVIAPPMPVERRRQLRHVPHLEVAHPLAVRRAP